MTQPRNSANGRTGERLPLSLAVLSTAAVTVCGMLLARRITECRDMDSIDDAASDNPAKECIYLDYNGTTPVYPNVLKAMLPYLKTHFGNPSSGHAYAAVPKQAIDTARLQLLELLGADTAITPLSTVWFTACGTESDNLAIQAALESNESNFQTTASLTTKLPHIVTSNVEHPAVSAYLEKLERQRRIEVTYVPVQTDGRVLARDVINAVEKKKNTTVLVTLMLANNESGAVQPIREVSEYCRQNKILMHTDAAQAAGKISIALRDLGNPDLISVVGHKMGAPKGVAALYVRDGCLSENGRTISSVANGIMLIGGEQEFGRRAGTQNTPYIVGMGAASEYALANLGENRDYCEKLRSRLLQKLTMHLGKDVVHPNGPADPAHRLPNTLSVGLRNVHSGSLLNSIGDKVAASAGATCHSADAVSSVLRAMQVPIEVARGTLRLSVGPTTTMVEVDRAAYIIAKEVRRQLAAP